MGGEHLKLIIGSTRKLKITLFHLGTKCVLLVSVKISSRDPPASTDVSDVISVATGI